MNYKETLDNELTQQHFQALLEENKELMQEIEDLKFEAAMKDSIQEHKYEYEIIIQSEEFKNKRHILALGGFYTEFLINLVDKYGYEYVNNYLLEKLDAKVSDKGV